MEGQKFVRVGADRCGALDDYLRFCDSGASAGATVYRTCYGGRFRALPSWARAFTTRVWGELPREFSLCNYVYGWVVRSADAIHTLDEIQALSCPRDRALRWHADNPLESAQAAAKTVLYNQCGTARVPRPLIEAKTAQLLFQRQLKRSVSA